MALRLTTLGANRILASGLSNQVSGGSLRLYAGSRPKTVEAGLELQVLLAEIPLQAFAAPTIGTLVTTQFEPVIVQASGEARWAHLIAADGSRLGDVSVGTADRDTSPDVMLDRTDFQKGGTVLLSKLTLVLPTA